MIAAIYARKSTDQTGTADEEKSVTRQLEHARAYAAKKGWLVSDEHLYVDDGISGAEFVKRPGFLRLMNALKPRPPFQVLIMSEESRLGREQIETAYALKQIMDAGVRVFFYLEDRERTLDTAMDKVMLSLTGFAAEMEREKARQRTYDAMRRKAQALQVTGGAVYGYDNLEVLSPTPGPDGRRKRLHVVRRINPDQAAVVRRIFEMYATGKGLTKIAKALNAEHVPPPRRDGKGWAPSAVREMLYRPLYRGEIVWNRSQKVMRGGTKKQQRRPEKDWLHLDAPELRIIPDDLWRAVHERLARVGNTFARARGGHLQGRPSRLDIDSPYLLTGMARCGVCGGTIQALTRGHGAKRARFYGCGYNHKRGSTICPNGLQIRQDILDGAVLHAINDVLDERTIEAAVDKALERLRSGQERDLDRRGQIERELSLIEHRIQRTVDAIANAGPMEELVARLREEKARKQGLVQNLDGLGDLERIVSLDTKRLAHTLRERVADTKALLVRNIPQARQMLRKLVPDRVTLEPFEENGERGYRFTGEGTYARLFACATFGGGPNGIRTRVSALRGPCPRPLDDGAGRLPCCARLRLHVRDAGSEKWLGEEGSNPHYQGQNLASYH